MSWRTKMWFANAGSAFTAALIFAFAGSLLWIAFLLLTGIYWQFGEAAILADEKKRSTNPTDNQQGE